MPLPLIAGVASVVGGAIFKGSQKLARYVLIGSALVLVATAVIKLSSIYFSIYAEIQGAVDGIGTTYGGLLGCVINSLGIDDFLTSGLAIFTTASVFWGISVSYIITFKASRVAYKYIIKATE